MSGAGGNATRWRELKVFFEHLLGLWPGRKVSVLSVHPVSLGDLSSWSETEVAFVIEEGRRQLDRQFDELERIRGRSQFLFSTCLGFFVVLAANHPTVADAQGSAPLTCWVASLVLSGLAALGAVAVIVARKDMRAIDAALLTNTDERPLAKALALAYARCVRDTANTVATELTVFRDAVLLLMCGAALDGVAWFLAVR